MIDAGTKPEPLWIPGCKPWPEYDDTFEFPEDDDPSVPEILDLLIENWRRTHLLANSQYIIDFVKQNWRTRVI